MNGLILAILVFILGYIPSAYIVSRARRGVDIRQLGGGKGLATAMGVFFALFPLEMLIILAIAAVPIAIIRNPTLAIGIGLAFLPLLIWQFDKSGAAILYSILLPLFVSWRHIPTTKQALATRGMKGTIFDNWRRLKRS